ncbi:MAG: DUF3857 and transglutaminase domain-containing protein [Bacteroidetes bacterium]|nr:DUF3857 and transglutaminase domain-containing protein [Bacteroidota bacterium]
MKTKRSHYKIRNYSFTKFSLCTAFLLLFLVPGFSQKFGKIEADIIRQKAHPEYPEEAAAYLFHNCKASYLVTSSDIFLQLEIHQRIKVYKQSGEKYSEFSIPLYKTISSRERFSGLKAVVFNDENGNIVETKFQNKNLFDENSTENLTTKKFALPNVKEGSVIEIKYKIISPFIYTIPRWYFQTDIPVDHSEYSVLIPSYLTFTPVPTGFIPIEKSESIVGATKETRYTFTAKNIKPFKEDKYVLNEKDYISSLKYELYSVHFKGQTPKYYSKNWNEISKTLMNDKKFGEQIRKKIKEVEPVIEACAGMEKHEKIKHIYDYIINNFSWNETYGKYTENGLKNLLKEKSGNVGDINLLLLNMLQKAGIDAKPLLTKSRFNGLLNTIFPTLTELNYLMAYIPKDNGYMVLDATSKYYPVGQLPLVAINMFGLLIEGESGKVVEMNNPNIYTSQTLMNYVLDADNDRLQGSGATRLRQYGATRMRIKADEKEDENDQDIEISFDEKNETEDDNELDDIINILEASNVDDIYKPVTIKYEKTLYRGINKIGNQIFLNATLDFGLKENPFLEESREFPIFYNSLTNYSHNVNIDIPENYTLSSIPEPIKFVLPDDKASFSYIVSFQLNKISIIYKLKINESNFLPEEYPSLKHFYDLIIEKQNEKIVLKEQ